MYKEPTLTCTSQVDPQIIVDPVRAERQREGIISNRRNASSIAGPDYPRLSVLLLR